MFAILHRLPKTVKKINAIEFSGGTALPYSVNAAPQKRKAPAKAKITAKTKSQQTKKKVISRPKKSATA